KVAMAQSSTATGALREARAAKDMRFNKLGDSDLLVSEVCLGTMTWGKQTSEQDALDQLNLSFDEYGVNFLDTAEGYPIPLQPSTSGATDLMIGKWLKTRERSKVIVASKVCGASKRLNWFRDDKAATRVTKKQVKESVEKSLKRLGTDYIDLLQIHWPDRYVPLFGPNKYDYRLEVAAVPFEEQLEAMAELIQEGKVRNWGLSNETPFGVMAFAARNPKSKPTPEAVSVQNSYSLLTREFDSAMAEVCSPSHTNTPLIPYSPLSAGVLTGKYELSIAAASANNPDCRLNLLKGYRTRYQSSLAPQAIAEYAGVAAKYGMSMSHLALAFVASRPFVPSTIVGATSTAQLEDNI
ncbi:NADP-dependent oxidoreductase domain-containing protein, partial [Baffinella frigidus]